MVGSTTPLGRTPREASPQTEARQKIQRGSKISTHNWLSLQRHQKVFRIFGAAPDVGSMLSKRPLWPALTMVTKITCVALSMSLG